MKTQNPLMTRLIAWRDRGYLAMAMCITRYILTTVRNAVVLVFLIAGALFLYGFYNATPETTVYQLAELLHSPWLWKVATLVSLLYTTIVLAVGDSFLECEERHKSKSTGR